MQRAFPIPFTAMLALGALGALATGCDHKAKQTLPQSAETPVPAPIQLDPTRIPELATWRPLGDFRPSFAGPHLGSFQKVYLNATAADALDRGTSNPWPEGSQFVKEALDKHRKRMAYFWMSKEQGKWVWASGSVDGKVAARFPGESSGACAACHAARATRFDGVFSPGLVEKPRLGAAAPASSPATQPGP